MKRFFNATRLEKPLAAYVRRLYWLIVGLTTTCLILYISYVAIRYSQNLPAAMQPASSEDLVPYANINEPEKLILPKGTDETNLGNISSVTTLLPTSTSDSESNLHLIRGVPTVKIYDKGHIYINAKQCSEFGRHLQLLIIVTSAPSHACKRMAIRQTWGHYAARRDVAIVFMLGITFNAELRSKIRQEQYLYEDIVGGKFLDTYENLSLKVVSMLEWVRNYCPETAFVLKTDDDMFINIPRLLTFIGEHSRTKRAIYGRLAHNWTPSRNIESKYYISPEEYEPEVFPDFTTGPAYLFPANLAKDLYAAALNHPFFKLEDVFLTGFVAGDLKIKKIASPEFYNEHISRSIQQAISIHGVNEHEQFDLWKKYFDDFEVKCN